MRAIALGAAAGGARILLAAPTGRAALRMSEASGVKAKTVHSALGWIPGEVVRIAPAGPGLKVPHMGWNALEVATPHPVLAGIATGDHVYFVHSYHLVPEVPAQRIATVDHGGPVTAVVARDNLVGTQFHPEKSQATGLRLIANFLAWRP